MFKEGDIYPATSLDFPQIYGEIKIISEKGNFWPCRLHLHIPHDLNKKMSIRTLVDIVNTIWETEEGYIELGYYSRNTITKMVDISYLHDIYVLEGMAVNYADNLDVVEKLYGK